jgi:hypothetical protein
LPNAGQLAAALEARKRGISAKGLLLLSAALDSAFGGTPPGATLDGADQIADIVAAVASDKQGVVDERRNAATQATRDRVHRATAAANAAAAQTAAAGDLEDLGGGGSSFADAVADLPDRAELERLRGEVARRIADLTKQMGAARDAATSDSEKAKAARNRGATDEASALDRKADAERARMHALLSELASLEGELKDLEASLKAIGDIPTTSTTSSSPPPRGEAPPRPSAPPRSSIDDELARLKRQGGGASGPSSPPRSASSGAPPRKPAGGNVDDELAALKKKMQNAPPKKK